VLHVLWGATVVARPRPADVSVFVSIWCTSVLFDSAVCAGQHSDADVKT